MDYRNWLSQEHISDRIHSPGFLGVRLFSSVDNERSHFFLYVTEGPEVMKAPPYLHILNHPSPWTKRIMVKFRAHDAEAPAHYWFSNLPAAMPWQPMVDTVMGRWRIERDYLELKQELGLGHFEGRNWRGFHHHASLCIAAYGFLMLERLSGTKKNSARFKTPAVPAAFRPRGAGSDAAPHPLVDRDVSLPVGTRRRQNPPAMPMLRAGRS